MAFITDAVLLAACKYANSQSSVALPANWTNIAPTANVRAYNRLRGVILGRYFTPAQFAAWGAASTDDGYDWNLRLGVIYAFLEASKGDDDRGRAYLDELKAALEELQTLPIVISGVIVRPTEGRVSYGDVSTADDRVLLDEPGENGEFTLGDGTRL